MLEKLKVLDLSTVLAGPSVATFFAELGAEVIKIEHPIHGDSTRSWRIPGEKAEVTSYFSSINYKKSLRLLDLLNPQDRTVFHELIVESDVVIMNFKPSDYPKFQLTDQDLRALNPRLIIAKISGFGNDADRVAYDLILQAETGFMSMNGEPNSQGLKMPLALIDVLAAHQLKEAILLALLKRQQTGEGSTVSVSLYDAAICSLANQASAYLMNGFIPRPIGSLHPNIAPYGEVFTTKDGKSVVFAIGTQQQFTQLCEILGIPDTAQDPRFNENVRRVEHRQELFLLLQSQVVHMNAEELEKQTRVRRVPMGRIKAMNEVFSHPEAQNLVREELQGSTLTRRVSQIAFQWK
jgi:crotonobetainyl-CoA:carnitine CoA-transferase CaiB-like acyl-CoA transferase